MGFRSNFKDEENTDPNVARSPFSNTQANAIAGAKSVAMPDLGLLNAIIQDPDVTEIMVNDLRNIAIEKHGQIIVTPIRFKTIDELNRIVRVILDPSGKAITPESPIALTSLPDGSRVHIVAPPVVENGPCITIRRFPKRFQIDNFIANGMMDRRMAHFLEACVIGKQNILISGGTGTGKTSLLNSLLLLVPPHERVITIEDSAEIPVVLPNQVKMMTRESNLPEEQITANHLVANALRMRPDRIIVGECRGIEAMDMIQAMNTGHQGSMTTIHANSARDALSRLETLMMGNRLELNQAAIRRQIAGSIQLIVQLRRFQSGSRKVVSIQEVTGIEENTILLQEIFAFELTNPNQLDSDEGAFRYHLSSKVAENLKSQGIRPLP
jgi:pilus assembly protein CpaF